MFVPPTGPFGPHQPAERLATPRRGLRAGLSQLAGLAVGLALGLTLPRITSGPQADATRTAEVLSVVGIAILGVASLIFSLLFLVVQWVAGNFSHRLALFRTDPLVWRVFAFVIGLISFTISATLAIGARPRVSVAVPLLTGVAALVALALVRHLQLRAFSSIQLARVLADIATRGQEVLDAFYPRPGNAQQSGPQPGDAQSGDPPSSGPSRQDPGTARLELPAVRGTVTWPNPTATIAQINLRRLVESAQHAGVIVVLRVPVGSIVNPGDPVADVRGGHLAGSQVLTAIIDGRERTFHQDPLFAFRLLADIGLRALSPAINDPATAVQVLDATEGLLLRLVDAQLDATGVPDEQGAVRVILDLPTWTEYLAVALDDLCSAATASPMALACAIRLLRDLIAAAPPERHDALRERLAWVEHQLAERHPPHMQAAPP